MNDFSIKIYTSLLDALSKQGFSFQPFLEYLNSLEKKAIFLRHDVDLLPLNSLEIAKLEAEKGIKGTYYFRIVPESFDEKVIKEIHSLGHEIGYHYEDVSLAAVRLRAQGSGLREEEIARIAIESFKQSLERLRRIVPVSTICMHGSPMNRWDSRLLWKYYDYRDFGIIGEPYFDVNFEKILYLTDTGRRWDGEAVSIRDKAQVEERSNEPKRSGARRSQILHFGSSELRAQGEIKYQDWKVKPISGSLMNPTKLSTEFQNNHKFRSTYEIISAIEEGRFPDKTMMTFHPQRWTDRPIPWVKELVWQNVKNVGKYFLIKMRN